MFPYFSQKTSKKKNAEEKYYLIQSFQDECNSIQSQLDSLQQKPRNQNYLKSELIQEQDFRIHQEWLIQQLAELEQG